MRMLLYITYKHANALVDYLSACKCPYLCCEAGVVDQIDHEREHAGDCVVHALAAGAVSSLVACCTGWLIRKVEDDYLLDS